MFRACLKIPYNKDTYVVNKEVKKFTTNILGLFQGLKSKGISLAKEIKQIFVNDAVRLN